MKIVSETGSSITHVTDTALWVATFRALEGQRTDAAFDDPLAALLAGERGPRIARAIRRSSMVAWSIIIRTSAIDRLIYEALDAGIDTVLNLGAGLDTRPYRMKLPASLRWVEVDFPSIVELKNSMLFDRQPVCALERIGMDLLNRAPRQDLFARCGACSSNILVLTEGFLPYLTAYDASTLASDLHATSSMGRWIQDFDNAGGRAPPRAWRNKLSASPFLFVVKDWFEFFKQYGWRTAKVITSFEQSKRIARPYPIDFPYGLIMRAMPRAIRQRILTLSGAVLLQKDAVPVKKDTAMKR